MTPWEIIGFVCGISIILFPVVVVVVMMILDEIIE